MKTVPGRLIGRLKMFLSLFQTASGTWHIPSILMAASWIITGILILFQLTANRAERIESANNLKRVQANADFIAIVTHAQNGDRESFDKLQHLANDPKFDRHEEALQIYWNIVNAHNIIFSRKYSLAFEEKKKEIDFSKLSFESMRDKYLITTEYEVRAGLLEYIWERKDFSKKQKMEIVMEVMRNDKDLHVVAFASDLFQTESKQKSKNLLTDPLFEWWEKNKAAISDKPARRDEVR